MPPESGCVWADVLLQPKERWNVELLRTLEGALKSGSAETVQCHPCTWLFNVSSATYIVVEGSIITGGSGEPVYIPKITYDFNSRNQCPIQLGSCPVSLATGLCHDHQQVARTVTAQVVGIDLSTPCFAGSQLYMGCSPIGCATGLSRSVPHRKDGYSCLQFTLEKLSPPPFYSELDIKPLCTPE